jgi:hypothetical protein
LPGDLATAPLGLAAVADKKLKHRFTVLKRIVLPQVTKAQSAATDHFSRVERFVPQQHLADGALARSVAADQSNLLVVRQRAARSQQKLLLAIALVGVE